MESCKLIRKQENGIAFFELSSPQLKVICTNLGCHITSIYSKDKKGQWADVVLSYDNVETGCKDGCCMGGVIGRVANRIGGGAFRLNGIEYKLALNNGPNTLHGGIEGFHQKVFTYEMMEDGMRFQYISPDMEEGFPGTLTLTVTYRLRDDTLYIDYDADTDKDTIVNFTSHSYYNLTGSPCSVCDHELKIASEQMALIDGSGLSYGEYQNVEGTPFDFREFHKIGERIDQDDNQLKNGGGYDHDFILHGDKDQIELKEEASGRILTITTDMPSVQIYTANFLKDCAPGKCGVRYENRCAVAIETQFVPNAINTQKEPETILRAGDHFHSQTSYKFHTV